MMIVTVSKGLPKLHSTPLASISCSDAKVVVEADDENESRLKMIFEPYQAIRMTTVDCFDMPDNMTIIPQTVIEIENSNWISELRNNLKKTDHHASFMDNTKHFLLPLQDDFLEIIAWKVSLSDLA